MLKETWKLWKLWPVEGVDNAKSFPFFICRGSPDACREVDVTLAICFCVLSALIVALTDLYMRPEAHWCRPVSFL